MSFFLQAGVGTYDLRSYTFDYIDTIVSSYQTSTIVLPGTYLTYKVLTLCNVSNTVMNVTIGADVFTVPSQYGITVEYMGGSNISPPKVTFIQLGNV